MYFIYILFSEKFDRYYIGSCKEVSVRLLRHNSKGVPSTKPYVPWKLVYTEEFITRADATKREKEIKAKKSRKYIEYLIAH
jgi:putative endonuclease